MDERLAVLLRLIPLQGLAARRLPTALPPTSQDPEDYALRRHRLCRLCFSGVDAHPLPHLFAHSTKLVSTFLP